GKLINQNGVRWPVAGKYAMRNQPIRRPLGPGLLGWLSERKRFTLRKNIRQKYVVVLLKRMEWPRKCDEVAGNEQRSLMDHLIERMLTVGSRLSPVNGVGLVCDGSAIHRHTLTVTLHG